MEPLEFVVPCLFGLEGLAGEELRRMNMENVRVENGRVRFRGGMAELVRANLWLRTGERVLLVLAEFEAKTFEALFQGVLQTPLERFIPSGGAFPVKGHCLNSQLMSVPDCQAIVKKAAARRLGAAYGLNWLPEDGETYQLQFSIMQDHAMLFLDTTGVGLHKRGYRPAGNAAPLRETLAAGMVLLTHYRGRECFFDPLCGSGTIPIEAALIAKNRAPGLNRQFAAQRFAWLPPKLWQEARQEARAKEFSGRYRIFGADNDPQCVSISIANARRAGVDGLIQFRDGDATRLPMPEPEGILVCNPPYGQRMLQQREAQQLYAALGRHWRGYPDWSRNVITSEPEFEHYFGARADKKRKLYNGMIPCNYYLYYAKKKKRDAIHPGGRNV